MGYAKEDEHSYHKEDEKTTRKVELAPIQQIECYFCQSNILPFRKAVNNENYLHFIHVRYPSLVRSSMDVQLRDNQTFLG